MLCIALGFQSAFTLTHAANDLEKWNSEVGRTVRQAQSDKLAQTTYKEISSKNVKVAQDMRTVYPQIETQAQVAGSRTRVVAEAVLEVDKEKVARDWNKKLSKVGKATNAVGAALVIGGYILDAVDWVIDEGGKVTKHPNPDDIPYDDPSQQYYYQISYGSPSTKYSSISSLCSEAFIRGGWNDGKPGNGYSCVLEGSRVVATTPWGGSMGQMGSRVDNPSYNPSAPPPETTVVSEEEKEQVLKDLLNDPKYADLAAQMIGNTYSMGPENPEPDPNVVNDLKNKQKDVLKSDNPKGDGKTRTDPKIDTGTQGQADTTPKPDPNQNPNPDPGTTPTPNPNPNTGSTTTFELPPFCDYAAIVCDWIDWTKEEPEEEEPEEEEEINDKGIFDRKFDINFDFKKNCPPDYVFAFETKYIAGSYNFTFNWLCIFFNGIGYPLVFLSHCLGAWIFYEVAVRRGNQGG
jgi:hypothetical protein